MREISTGGTAPMGSNPSLSSPPTAPESQGFEGVNAGKNTPNSHVTHNAAVPGAALPGTSGAPDHGPVGRREGPIAGIVSELAQAVGLGFTAARLESAYAAAAERSQGAPALVGEPGQGPSGDPPVTARHCAESWRDDGDVLQHCTAALSDELNCTVCEGQRCYTHCGAVDHFEDAEPYYELLGSRRRVKIVRMHSGMFAGHLAVLEKRGWRVLVRHERRDVERLTKELCDLFGFQDDGGPAPATPPGGAVVWATDDDGGPGADDDPYMDDDDDGDDGSRVVRLPAVMMHPRHVSLLEAVLAAAAQSLSALPLDVLDAIAALAVAKPDVNEDALREFYSLPVVSPRHYRALQEDARVVVAAAFAHECEDEPCVTLRRDFGHLNRGHKS